MSSAGAECVERPDADPVHTCACQVQDGSQGDSAGSLELDPRRNRVPAPYCLGQGFGAKIIHQDDVGVAPQRTVELLERVDLDLDERRSWSMGSRGRDRRGDCIGSAL